MRVDDVPSGEVWTVRDLNSTTKDIVASRDIIHGFWGSRVVDYGSGYEINSGSNGNRPKYFADPIARVLANSIMIAKEADRKIASGLRGDITTMPFLVTYPKQISPDKIDAIDALLSSIKGRAAKVLGGDAKILANPHATNTLNHMDETRQWPVSYTHLTLPTKRIV